MVNGNKYAVLLTTELKATIASINRAIIELNALKSRQYELQREVYSELGIDDDYRQTFVSIPEIDVILSLDKKHGKVEIVDFLTIKSEVKS